MIPDKFKLPLIKTKRWKLITLFAVALSVLVLVTSIAILLLLQAIIELKIRQDSVLDDGTIILEKWSSPEYFIRTNMFTYSVKNPDEVTQGSIPSLKRIGPYVFDQKQKRKIHSRGNNTLKYETFQYYNFDEESSCSECFLYNRIWIPNIVYQKFVEAASKPAMKAAIAALVVQTPFLEVEVAELLFDGYADPFLDQVCSLPVVNFVCEQILDLPERIGLFYKKNGSSSGIYEVEDGHKDDGESLGKIISWNNASRLPEYWWESPQAIRINGTDGTLLPPYVSKDERITVFVAELCRSIDLVFQKEVEYAGVPLYRFVVPEDVWDWTLPKNKGFCHSDSGKKFFEQQEPKCLPPGLLDVSITTAIMVPLLRISMPHAQGQGLMMHGSNSTYLCSRCQKGEPPVVISLPNFLYAPDYVQQSIDGIRRPPEQELDQIEVDIEPRLGTIVQAHRRFLINFSMWKGVNLTMPDLNKFRSSIVPVLEIDEYIHIDDGNLDLIKSKLILVEKTVTLGSIFCAIISLMVLAFAAFYIFRRRRNHAKLSLRQPNLVVPAPLNGNVSNSNRQNQSNF